MPTRTARTPRVSPCWCGLALLSWCLVTLPLLPNVLALDLPFKSFDAPGYTFTIGSRAWLSYGHSAHDIAGPNYRPNVASELTYSGLNTTVAQFNADLVLRRVPVLKRLVFSLSGGYGSMGNGTLRDQDWSASNRTTPISDTISSVNGEYVANASIDAGLRPLEWSFMNNPLPGGLDLLVGYQFWQEQYQAQGVAIVGGPQINNNPAITQTNTWNSLRVGSRLTLPVHSHVAFRGSVFYIPWTHYQSDDIHHQRADLAQDPSFRSIATGGSGIQLEGSLLVRVWGNLSAEAGYAYWDIRSGSGTVNAYLANGGIVAEPLNQDNTRRQGVFFGLNYLF